MKPKRSIRRLGLLALLASTLAGHSAVTVTVDPGATWLGFMNVFELPSNGGGYVFGSPWGTPDLRAAFSGNTLTLSPNTVADPAPFWYTAGPESPGNKIMAASMYVEINGGLGGQTLNFTGRVSANSFTAAHTTKAFIKDFAPDYSSVVVTELPITNGTFTISLATINDPGRHIQYGFETIGVNVWSTQVTPFGSISIVPEPATLGLAALGGLAFLRRRRNKS